MQVLFSVPESQVETIVNGVDVDRFKPDQVARRTVRTELGLESDNPVFGTVGRLVPVKDYATLLKAFGVASREHAGAKLLIVGDGPEAQSLKALADSLSIGNSVIFAGNHDDVPALLAAMDVFCLTSIREGMSNTLLEAHACGLPVLATDTGGNPEIVDAGTTGYLVPVGDVDTLASRMRCLEWDSAKRRLMGEAARQRSITKFSLSTMVENYERLYERVTGQEWSGQTATNLEATGGVD
jgi:glycosyltransferase involved in cell wall biosynthesis